MRRLVIWLLAVMLTIGVTVVAFCPAGWMASIVEKQSGGRLALGDPQGTLWRGSAFVGGAPAADEAVTPLLPGRFAWKLSPLSLLGLVELELENPDALSQPVKISGGWSQWQVSPSSVVLPAERLAGLGAPLNTIQPSGRMRLSWGALQVARQGGGLAVTGPAVLEMEDIASRLSPVRPLGSYKMAMDWHDRHAQLTLSTTKGPMLLDGTGTLDNGRLQFSGTARAEPEQEERLANLLSLLGQRRMEGNRNVIALEFK
jgi:general secretion pathway protein N